MDSLILPVNKNRLYLMAILFAVTLAMSGTIMFKLELIMKAELRIATMVIAFLGCTFSGYAALYFALRARQQPPVIHADREGIRWDVSMFNRGFAPWSNVKDYAIVKHAGSTLLLVNLKDPFDTIDRQEGLVKRFLTASLKRYRTPAAIPTVYLDEDASEALKRIAAFGKRMS